LTKQLNRFNWNTFHFYDAKTAQCVLDLGPTAFIALAVLESRKPVFHIAGAAFDLGCNGCGKEALWILAESLDYFPYADLGRVAGYIQAVHNSGERPSVKARFAKKIQEKYNTPDQILILVI
jgi:hypothetical protein